MVWGGRVHLFLTARLGGGDWDGGRTIGLATSDDLVHWRVHPPVLMAGDFWLLEVPQVLHRRGRWWLIASTTADWHARRRLARLEREPRHGGIAVYVADHICGPYVPARDEFLVGDDAGTHYTGKIVQTPSADVLVASRFLDENGEFLGALADPVRVS
ncbi:MAG: hypothetical protein M3N17_02140 [Actinomycetota bacterium]|nr:hypothetical protein [Actinomycetota bacterium]